MPGENERKNFFISYTRTDRTWAEWIAWQLEEARYTTVLQAWDFRPASNFILEMNRATQEAERTIAVLSPDYLNAPFAKAEWAAAFRQDPTGDKGILLPVHVRECKHLLTGLLGTIVYIDLVGLDDERLSREALLAGIHRERAKPVTSPRFPTGSQYIGHSVVGQPRFPGAFPRIWNVPYQRSPFFTGHEDVLRNLYNTLRVGKTVALVQPRALTGLGGIGKTQTATEYLYRYYSDYPEAILWVKADSREVLASDFVTTAGLLSLPEKDEQEQNLIVDAVKRWLKDHTDWLLVFDNVEDLEMVKSFIPSAHRGHILLTTRIHSMGTIAQAIEIEKMLPDEGACLLLRRASLIAPDDALDSVSEADCVKAKEISEVLDGLPLALEQAGAYIEETGCDLSEYLSLYRSRRKEFLSRRSRGATDYPETVATTWSLSFQKVEQANPASAELLRLCAFLAPDAISEEIIRKGASELGPILQPVAANPFELNIAIGELLNYSLVHRNPKTKTLTIHRLVQAVLKDGMNEDKRHQWAERTVHAINCIFPEVESATWPYCQKYLPHARVCAEYIEQWHITSEEAVRLLNQVGFYLKERASYAEAESLLWRSLTIREQTLGPEHLDVATGLNNLAMLYDDQGKYPQAESLYQQALAIHEKILGPEHLDVATNLYNIALLYDDQARYTEAEPLCQRALAIHEKALGPKHPIVAADLNNLAGLYRRQGKYNEAESFLLRALSIYEEVLGAKHLLVAMNLDNLAGIYRRQGKYNEAESFFHRALAIREEVLGLEHPDVATSLNGLAVLYDALGQYGRAEPFYQRALSIYEAALGPEHPYVAIMLNNLAGFFLIQGKGTRADPLIRRALAIDEQALGQNHPGVAADLNCLAVLCRTQCKYDQAESFQQRALAINQKGLGLKHANVAQNLHNLAVLYHTEGKYTEAESLYQRALSRYKEAWGPEHPEVATNLSNLAQLYDAQGEYTQAELLYQQALAMYKRIFGLRHPDITRVVVKYAGLLRKTKREDEAAQLEAQIRVIPTNDVELCANSRSSVSSHYPNPQTTLPEIPSPSTENSSRQMVPNRIVQQPPSRPIRRPLQDEPPV